MKTVNYGNLVIDGNLVKPNTRIEFKVTQNPKRAGSQAHARFAEYMQATTVEEYFQLGAVRADLKYDVEHGFIEILEES